MERTNGQINLKFRPTSAKRRPMSCAASFCLAFHDSRAVVNLGSSHNWPMPPFRHLRRKNRFISNSQSQPQSIRAHFNPTTVLMAMMMDPTLRLLLDLMSIPSSSEEEGAIGLFLQQILERLGYTTKRTPISRGSDRCNIYAYLEDEPSSRVCLTCHMDTVPPHIPAKIVDNVVYGRGACDDKGPMAAQITAAEELRKEGAIKPGDLSLLFVVGEERGGPGMLAANDMDLKWDAVIFGEPTESKLATGHKGHFVFELTAEGIASHSGYPQKGHSANEEMLLALNHLSNLEMPHSALLGPSTYHCARIRGGTAYNVLASHCYAQCAIRISADLPEVRRMVRQTISQYQSITLQEIFAYGETMLDHDVPGMSSQDEPVAGWLTL